MATSIPAQTATQPNQEIRIVSRSRRKSLRLSQSKASPKGISDSSQPSVEVPLSLGKISPNSNMGTLLIACLIQLQDHELIYIDQTACGDGNCPHCHMNSQSSSDRSSELVIYPSCTRLQPTALGRAVLSSSLGPTHGLMVFEEINKARRSIALDTDLHLVYLVRIIFTSRSQLLQFKLHIFFRWISVIYNQLF